MRLSFCLSIYLLYIHVCVCMFIYNIFPCSKLSFIYRLNCVFLDVPKTWFRIVDGQILTVSNGVMAPFDLKCSS